MTRFLILGAEVTLSAPILNDTLGAYHGAIAWFGLAVLTAWIVFAPAVWIAAGRRAGLAVRRLAWNTTPEWQRFKKAPAAALEHWRPRPPRRTSFRPWPSDASIR